MKLVVESCSGDQSEPVYANWKGEKMIIIRYNVITKIGAIIIFLEVSGKNEIVKKFIRIIAKPEEIQANAAAKKASKNIFGISENERILYIGVDPTVESAPVSSNICSVARNNIAIPPNMRTKAKDNVWGFGDLRYEKSSLIPNRIHRTILIATNPIPNNSRGSILIHLISKKIIFLPSILSKSKYKRFLPKNFRKM